MRLPLPRLGDGAINTPSRTLSTSSVSPGPNCDCNFQAFIIAHSRTLVSDVREPEPANRCIGDYESLQTLHQWKIDFLRADRLEMTYSDEIRLCIDCTNFIPNTSTKEVVLVPSKEKEVGHPMTESLFGLLKAGLKSRSKSTLPQVSPCPVSPYCHHPPSESNAD
jgi:hypothetical protein